jgi:hypothetical protein
MKVITIKKIDMIKVFDEQTGKVLTGIPVNICRYHFDLLVNGKIVGRFDVSHLNKLSAEPKISEIA